MDILGFPNVGCCSKIQLTDHHVSQLLWVSPLQLRFFPMDDLALAAPGPRCQLDCDHAAQDIRQLTGTADALSKTSDAPVLPGHGRLMHVPLRSCIPYDCMLLRMCPYRKLLPKMDCGAGHTIRSHPLLPFSGILMCLNYHPIIPYRHRN